jgi:hypothetical protein
VNALAVLSPTFGKGIAVTVCAFILFVGSVYVLLAAIYGRKMGYFVLMVGFFGWMIVLSGLWVVGSGPLKVSGESATLPDLGPRGTEPHWRVIAAGPGTADTAYPLTSQYPGPGWEVAASTEPNVNTLTSAVQEYLAVQAQERVGNDVEIPPGAFVVQNVSFATTGDHGLGAATAYFASGGPAITVFAVFDKGNVQIYSWAFLIGSLIGFGIHLPFLDRLERSRKEILTGGTAPPWYGPA